ncbi:MAG: NADH-quinone oxidoreductase subunit NuoE [Bacteroidales bacterium]|nr:NADH-quinone oxidoreductase subunit NuoE [Bacteroidales bacterium]
MPEVQKLVKEIADIHGRERSSLISILQDIVEKNGYLSAESITEVALVLDIAAADVYGTATFYSFLDTVPRGKYVIRICKTITCDMAGKDKIIKTLEELLGIKLGETTPDNNFTLLETNCLGWCHKGPAMLINDESYTELTPDKVHDIICSYKKDK